MKTNEKSPPALILASTSPYRKLLLQKLGLNFDSIPPEFDETRQPGESAHAASIRLAHGKAQAVANTQPWSVVVGSDQLCSLKDGQPIGKPGSVEKAIAQLQGLSGQLVDFYTSVKVIAPDFSGQFTDITSVQFRDLKTADIVRYLECEPEAIHCAGSFMAESLGICLFEQIRSDDPSALIGLPLIATSRLLRQAGFSLP